jgi:hypothetical protein
MERPSNIVLRLATLLFALLLGIESAWLVLADSFRSGIKRLPTDAAAATAARTKRPDATSAAEAAVIRGDLWAEAAFTYADLLWSDAKPGDGLLTQEVASARSALDHALDHGPHQSGAWLLRAGLASRYSLLGVNAQEALKMSYYTGPSEQDLMPLRLRIAMLSEAFSDSELNELIERDVRLLFSHQKKSPIASAYNAASPAGKRFIEQAVGKIDPTAIKSIRSGAPAQSLPD